jgi:hypothetical protein
MIEPHCLILLHRRGSFQAHFVAYGKWFRRNLISLLPGPAGHRDGECCAASRTVTSGRSEIIKEHALRVWFERILLAHAHSDVRLECEAAADNGRGLRSAPQSVRATTAAHPRRRRYAISLPSRASAGDPRTPLNCGKLGIFRDYPTVE